ncbi:MAG: ferritin-like domain-containing protein [Elainella sp.]
MGSFSRRRVLGAGAVVGLTGAVTLSAGRSSLAGQMGERGMVERGIGERVMASRASDDRANDAKILNGALYYEHQAIWAYQFAATKLSDTDVGRAVLALAQRNLADHMAHRDLLAQAVQSLGAMPVRAEQSYDLSAYIRQGEGNLDSDVNIAKLALALETDAAIAYTSEVSRLKTPDLISAGASIGSTESAHATAIRAAFVSLGVGIPYVPASFVSADTRSDWVLRV